MASLVSSQSDRKDYMAVVIDSLPIRGMRYTDFVQLLSYVESRENDGWYYGNREQFENRHNRIKDWLVFWVEELSKDGVRIPK